MPAGPSRVNQQDTSTPVPADRLLPPSWPLYTLSYIYDFVQLRTVTLKTHWFHILLSLTDNDLHGTAIMEEVLERTGGQIRLWPGKLYGALRELADAKLIVEVEPPEGAPTEGGRRRFYSITQLGRAHLRGEVERMAALVQVARSKGAIDAV